MLDEAEEPLRGIPSILNISQNDVFVNGRRPLPVIVSRNLSRESTALKNNRLIDNRYSADFKTENHTILEKSMNTLS